MSIGKLGYQIIGTFKDIELRADPHLNQLIYAHNGDKLIQIYNDTTAIEKIHKHLDELLNAELLNYCCQ